MNKNIAQKLIDQASEIDENGVKRLNVEKLVELVEAYHREDLARKIEKMPFGDTSASFAAWIRNRK